MFRLRSTCEGVNAIKCPRIFLKRKSLIAPGFIPGIKDKEYNLALAKGEIHLLSSKEFMVWLKSETSHLSIH